MIGRRIPVIVSAAGLLFGAGCSSESEGSEDTGPGTISDAGDAGTGGLDAALPDVATPDATDDDTSSGSDTGGVTPDELETRLETARRTWCEGYADCNAEVFEYDYGTVDDCVGDAIDLDEAAALSPECALATVLYFECAAATGACGDYEGLAYWDAECEDQYDAALTACLPEIPDELAALVTQFCEGEQACNPDAFAYNYETVEGCEQELTQYIGEYVEYSEDCADAIIAYYSCFVANAECTDYEGEMYLDAGYECEAEYEASYVACGGAGELFFCNDETYIDYASVCDGEPDCPDGEDELDCDI